MQGRNIRNTEKEMWAVNRRLFGHIKRMCSTLLPYDYKECIVGLINSAEVELLVTQPPSYAGRRTLFLSSLSSTTRN